MKNLILICSTFCLITLACSQSQNEDMSASQNEKINKIIELYDKYGLSQDKLLPLLNNEEFIAVVDTLSLDKLELSLKGFAEFEETTKDISKYWEKTKETPRFKEFMSGVEKSKDMKDLEELTLKYPILSEKIGLMKVVKERKENPIK